MSGPCHIAAAETAACLDYPTLIDRLDAAFRAGATAPLRHRHDLPGGGVMLIKPAWRDDGPVVVKIANVFFDNARRGLPAVHGGVMLYDGGTGALLATVDGTILTNRRTAAASALASRHLSRPDSATLLVVGTGQLAPELARGHGHVRPIRRVLVWGRNPQKAARVADALRRPGLETAAVSDLQSAVADADIVSTATLATAPLIRGDWLRAGQHLDLVGGFRPHMREADDSAISAGRLFVDTRDGAMTEAGDLVQPLDSGILAPADILGELAELCAGTVSGRRSADDITLFKSVGTALEDLAAAELVWERAAK